MRIKPLPTENMMALNANGASRDMGINPADARELVISAGDIVEVSYDFGSTYAMAYPATELKHDQTFMVFGMTPKQDALQRRMPTRSSSSFVSAACACSGFWNHAHADHLSAAHFLRGELGGKIAIGEHIRAVQGAFRKLFKLGHEFHVDGSQFDHLFREDEEFSINGLQQKALYVPGHTPADTADQIGDVVFVGDTLFMPDVRAARCHFPGGDAHRLYRSIRKLLDLPGDTRLFMCHDSLPKAGNLNGKPQY